MTGRVQLLDVRRSRGPSKSLGLLEARNGTFLIEEWVPRGVQAVSFFVSSRFVQNCPLFRRGQSADSGIHLKVFFNLGPTTQKTRPNFEIAFCYCAPRATPIPGVHSV